MNIYLKIYKTYIIPSFEHIKYLIKAKYETFDLPE